MMNIIGPGKDIIDKKMTLRRNPKTKGQLKHLEFREEVIYSQSMKYVTNADKGNLNINVISAGKNDFVTIANNFMAKSSSEITHFHVLSAFT